ncbi:MAG TPA: site-specific integrase [Nitrososphaerales archaeon]|nr:site-specific integrase [Nitrososphaerales archaeon]
MVEGNRERNHELIAEFLRTLADLSDVRISKYRVVLTKMSLDLGKPFDTVTRNELQEYLKRVNAKVDYSDWTKLCYRQFAKRLFGWLRDPGFVDWIRLGSVWSRVDVEDLLTDSELMAMRRACDNLRDRALVETAYESALRPHELLGLKKSSVLFDEYGAFLNVEKGKSGPRRVRVINAAPLLADWISNHPLRSKKAALWVDTSNDTTHRPLRLVGLSKLFKRTARKAEILKRVNPYVFRHTRLTHLSKVLTESVLCEFAGWVQGSEMARNYVHLSGRDVDEAILRAYGLIKSGATCKPHVPIRCVRCTTLNPHDAEICYRCGFALNERAAFRRDDEFQKLKEEVEQIRSQLRLSDV